LLVLVLLAGAGTVAWGSWAAEKFGRPDPPQCVSDEAAGQWLALAFLPITSARDLCIVAGMQFVLFRLLDIIKPPPVRQLEKLPAGWGILADDLAAGVLANLLGQVLLRTVWTLGQ
jgi:phosphatidylglycerophosphatase A